MNGLQNIELTSSSGSSLVSSSSIFNLTHNHTNSQEQFVRRARSLGKRDPTTLIEIDDDTDLAGCIPGAVRSVVIVVRSQSVPDVDLDPIRAIREHVLDRPEVIRVLSWWNLDLVAVGQCLASFRDAWLEEPNTELNRPIASVIHGEVKFRARKRYGRTPSDAGENACGAGLEEVSTGGHSTPVSLEQYENTSS